MTYAVDAAAIRFYGKHAHELALDESALLVGLLPEPSRYSPVRFPERALTKRNACLRVMRELHYIFLGAYAEVRARVLDSIQHEQTSGTAPYVTA